MFETAFVGNRGVKFRMLRQANEVNRVTGIRPNPNMGSSRYFSSNQNTVYASWQSSLRRRFSRNFLVERSRAIRRRYTHLEVGFDKRHEFLYAG